MLIYLVVIAAGATAGFINTLAGSGSLITLPLLIFLGLEADVANGTNRIGVLLAAIVAARTFQRQGHLQLRGTSWLFVPAIIGSIGGAGLAAVIGEQSMHYAIATVMVLMLGVILINPQRWLIAHSQKEPDHRQLVTVLVFLVVGAYGGFIQAGVGVFILTALVLRARYDLITANALKVSLVLLLTAPAIVVFAACSQVHWGYGLLMAAGQIAGAWAGAMFAARHPDAKIWIRRLLILVVVASIVKLFLSPPFKAGAEFSTNPTGAIAPTGPIRPCRTPLPTIVVDS